jgi:hypothetical protein
MKDVSRANSYPRFRLSRVKILSGYVAVAGAALKTAVSKKSFLLPLQALPADIPTHVRRRHKRVVMVHLAVAFFAANRRSVDCFRIDLFNHP